MDGRYGEVEAVENVELTQAMYNLTVDVAHTYFVGESQWLVHNRCEDHSTHPDFDRLATENGLREPKGEFEAQGILEAVNQGILSDPVRPRIDGSLPPDYIATFPDGNQYFVDIKTPRNPKPGVDNMRPEVQAQQIMQKIAGTSSDIRFVIDLRDLSVNDARVFLQHFAPLPSYEVYIVNQP